MHRRRLIQLLGIGAASTGLEGSASAGPRFFTSAEFDTVDRLCELLIPADPSGPGAHEAAVASYIDLVLEYGPSSARDAWRSGLAAVDDAARSSFGKPLLGCSAEQQGQLMDAMAGNEAHPQTGADRFFVLLKTAAVQGFSLSDAGRRALGERGDGHERDFPGCTHEEHRRA